MSRLAYAPRISFLALAWQGVLACGERRVFNIIVTGYALIAVALAWLPGLSLGGKGKTEPLQLLCFLGVLAIWALWLPRLILIARQLQQLCVPALQRRLIASFGLAWLGTVALPGIWLSVVNGGGLQPLLQLSLLAVLSLGMALLPAIVIAVLAGTLVVAEPLFGVGIAQIIDWLNAEPERMVLISLVMLPLLAWRIAQIIHPHWQPAALWRPWALELAQMGRSNRISQLAGGNQPLPVAKAESGRFWRWWNETGSVSGFGLHGHPPVMALRVWLGGVFSPIQPRYWLRQAMLFAAMLGFAPALLALMALGKPAATLPLAPLIWLMLLLVLATMMTCPALLRLRQRNTGEYPELALLPGLPSGKRLLLAAVFVPLLRGFGLLILLLLAMVPLLPEASAANPALLLPLLGFACLICTQLLRILAGLRSNGPAWLLGLLLGLLMFSGLSRLIDHDLGVAAWLLYLGSALLIALCLMLSAHALYRYRQLPHPFLL